jgi:predicted site-specific integrase-resolvase
MLDNLDQVDKVLVEYKDRLARFGFNYLEKLASAYNVEIEILEQKEDSSLDEEMVNDLIPIITSFSARIYGARGGKAVKKTLEELDKESDNYENDS